MSKTNDINLKIFLLLSITSSRNGNLDSNYIILFYLDYLVFAFPYKKI